MTVKAFFKSKTFVCIVVLLCIALVAGALLSIMNDLLFVDDAERVARTVNNIYGQAMDYEIVYDEQAEGQVIFAQTNDQGQETGRINNAYLLADGNYLVKSTGLQGYKQGSVSVWCVAQFANDRFVALSDVSVADYDKQTLMSKFTKSVLDGFGGNQPYDLSNHLVSGATYSTNAVNNALNVALAYVKTLEGGAE